MAWGNDWMKWGLERAAGTMQRKEQEAQQEAQQNEAQQQSMLQRASDVVQALMTRNADRDARQAEMMWKENQARQERIAALDRDAVRYTNERTQEGAREARADARFKTQLEREDLREKGRAEREDARDRRAAKEQELRDERQAKAARQLEAMRQAGRGAILDKRAAARLQEIRARAERDPLGELAKLEDVRQKYFAGWREDDIPQEYRRTYDFVWGLAQQRHPGVKMPGGPVGGGQQQETQQPEPGDIPVVRRQ